jgi:hypothetical protein
MAPVTELRSGLEVSTKLGAIQPGVIYKKGIPDLKIAAAREPKGPHKRACRS